MAFRSTYFDDRRVVAECHFLSSAGNDRARPLPATTEADRRNSGEGLGESDDDGHRIPEAVRFLASLFGYWSNWRGNVCLFSLENSQIS